MKIILIVKRFVLDVLKILFISINLMNCFVFYSLSTPQFSSQSNSVYSSIEQAVNFIPEVVDTKINLKVITVSFAEKFYSFDFYLKKTGNMPKQLTIISETDSEINLRNSSFLISELTTST